MDFRGKRCKRRSNNLMYQTLEPKNLLAGIAFDSITGVITVEGRNVDDAVHISNSANNQIRVAMGGVGSQTFVASQVNSIEFYGRNGNDWFRNDTSINSRAYGNNGNDTLVGGSGADRLRGGEGFDRLTGNSGNDFIKGDSQGDFLIGGNGNDRLEGTDGNDSIWGQDGDDFIIGGLGDDYADGGAGNDVMHGYAGNDHFNGSKGDDFIAGNAGDDWIYGHHGNDQVFGNQGRDDLFGGLGNDELYGGDSSDDIYGHQGSDDIYGGDGEDDLYGGANSDVIFGGSGNDDIYDDSSDSVYDDSSDYSSNGDFEVRGNVANLDIDSKTFSVLGISVSYANAEFVSDIENGTFVKAEGSYNGTTLNAHEVELELDSDRDENFEARGIVEDLNTTARTFGFFGFAVSYANARVDAQPVAGAQIQVEGVLTGNQINAHRLEVGTSTDGGDDSDDGTSGGGDSINGDIELRGNIENFNLSNRTFTLLGIQVNFANSQIRGQLGNGIYVKMDGRLSGSQINSREVETEEFDDRDENFEGQGVIENLDTNSQTFSFLGFTVHYDSARLRSPLQNGGSVEVEGWFNSGNIAAEEIK